MRRCFQHLLLRAHTAPPAAPRVFATATRTPYMVFFEAVELAHHEVSPPKTSRHLRLRCFRLVWNRSTVKSYTKLSPQNSRHSPLFCFV